MSLRSYKVAGVLVSWLFMVAAIGLVASVIRGDPPAWLLAATIASFVAAIVLEALRWLAKRLGRVCP